MYFYKLFHILFLLLIFFIIIVIIFIIIVVVVLGGIDEMLFSSYYGQENIELALRVWLCGVLLLLLFVYCYY